MPKRSEANITSRAAETSPTGLMWDREVPGFGLRTLSSGARTWLFKYRTLNGRQHWHRIGTFPAMTVDEARKEARALRAAVDKGKDPSKEREAARAAARAARAAAVEKLAESYAKVLPGRPSLRGSGAISAEHAAAEVAAVRNAVARMKLEGRPVAEITAADLLGLLHLEAARPATARLLFGAFGRFMEWCRDTGHLTVNPCDAIPRAKRPKPPPARRRVVALRDLARLWMAAPVLPSPMAELARLLILLPVRRQEGARLAWENVDLRAAVWTLPGAITKNGDPHRIALHPLARALVRARHKAMGKPACGLAFPSPRAGNEVSTWTAMKAEMAAAARFNAWTWHDFRRSFASIMAERGVAEPVADAVLNHRQSGTRGGVLGVYQHAQRWPEQKAALEKWGAALAEAIAAADRTRKVASSSTAARANPPGHIPAPRPAHPHQAQRAPGKRGDLQPSRRSVPVSGGPASRRR